MKEEFKELLANIGGDNYAPGGGTAAACCGALAASTLLKVAVKTKKRLIKSTNVSKQGQIVSICEVGKFNDVTFSNDVELTSYLINKLSELVDEFLKAADEDEQKLHYLIDAYVRGAEDIEVRQLDAAVAPAKVVELSNEGLKLVGALKLICGESLESDVITAEALFLAALEGGKANGLINLKGERWSEENLARRGFIGSLLTGDLNFSQSVRLTGKEVIRNILTEVETLAASFIKQNNGKKPILAVVSAFINKDGMAYVSGLKNRCQQVGVELLHIDVEDEQTMLSTISKLNNDPLVVGILPIQPLPDGFNKRKIALSIDENKDVDAMALSYGKGTMTPATALAVMEILKHYEVPLCGKMVLVVGRSPVIGAPVAKLLTDADATVAVAHSKTSSRDLDALIKLADIIILARGSYQWMKADVSFAGKVVVDVAINFSQDGKMGGDFDTSTIKGLPLKYTPVPGGVGSVTTSIILRNAMERWRDLHFNGIMVK